MKQAREKALLREEGAVSYQSGKFVSETRGTSRPVRISRGRGPSRRGSLSKRTILQRDLPISSSSSTSLSSSEDSDTTCKLCGKIEPTLLIVEFDNSQRLIG